VLGSDITIVRGSVNDTTTIGDDCVISHGSIIGHGSRIGRGCHISNHNSINGNVTLGEECFLGSAVVIRPQTRLADRTVVGAGAVVVKTFDEPGLVLVGAPAKPTQSASAKLAGVPRPMGV
jgi:UDP-3-O-[3-hydroxymyristoyl] glucosamine N-acyltransferase